MMKICLSNEVCYVYNTTFRKAYRYKQGQQNDNSTYCKRTRRISLVLRREKHFSFQNTPSIDAITTSLCPLPPTRIQRLLTTCVNLNPYQALLKRGGQKSSFLLTVKQCQQCVPIRDGKFFMKSHVCCLSACHNYSNNLPSP